MEKVRLVFSFGVLVVSFLFLPSENWSFWFLRNDAEKYGEFRVTESDRAYLLTKNLLETTVTIEGATIRSNLSIPISGELVFDLENRAETLPRSYSLLEILGGNPEEVVRSMNRKIYFEPQNLAILTPAEQSKWAILVSFLAVISSALTFSVVSYHLEAKSIEREGTEVSYSLSLQE